MERGPGTSGHIHQDCGAFDAVRVASSEHSQTEVPSVVGPSPLQPTPLTVTKYGTAKTKTSNKA